LFSSWNLQEFRCFVSQLSLFFVSHSLERSKDLDKIAHKILVKIKLWSHDNFKFIAQSPIPSTKGQFDPAELQNLISTKPKFHYQVKGGSQSLKWNQSKFPNFLVLCLKTKVHIRLRFRWRFKIHALLTNQSESR
jgi:hypothetical protein